MLKTPDQHLLELLKDFPNFGWAVESLVSSRGEDEGHNWPEWCFLPIGGWLAILQSSDKSKPTDPTSLSDYGLDIARLAAIGAWRYSQGVYEFNNDLYESLMASEHNGKLPVDLLKNLPEWSIYIPVKNDIYWGEEKKNPLVGFWVHLDFDLHTGREEMRFLFNFSDGRLMPGIMHLQYETLDGSLKSIVEASIKNMGESNNEVVKFMVESQKQQNELIRKVLPLILYLVSEPPAEDDHIKNPTLGYPSFKKTKKGLRLFPARGIRKWKVGESLGEIIRKERLVAYHGHSAGTKKVPHLRRGHWHGYWHGKGRTKYSVKWVRPTFVNNLED